MNNSARSLSQQRKDAELCRICFTRKMTARIDCCDHRFCSTCIKDWVKGDVKTCPLCRRDVNLINSIRTGKVLYRVRRQQERIPVIIVEVEEGDQAEGLVAQVMEFQWLERQRQEERQRQLEQQRQQERQWQQRWQRLQERERQPQRQQQLVMYPRVRPVDQRNYRLCKWILMALFAYFLFGAIFN